MPKSMGKPTGFTLIELMVAMVISLLVVGGGIAAYFNFNDRQALMGAGKQVQTYLRSAQTRARVGDRPAGCVKLQGYSVRDTSGGTQIQIGAVCDDGTGSISTLVQETRDMPANPSVVISGGLNMQFGVLHGGVTGAGQINLVSGSQTYRFSVTPGGEITDGQIIEQ